MPGVGWGREEPLAELPREQRRPLLRILDGARPGGGGFWIGLAETSVDDSLDGGIAVRTGRQAAQPRFSQFRGPLMKFSGAIGEGLGHGFACRLCDQLVEHRSGLRRRHFIGSGL